MKIQDLPFLPQYFDRYIARIPEHLELTEAFLLFSPENTFTDRAKLNALGDQVYAPGKWPVKEVIQHCIDTERIMAYRALCISRGERISLPGFDEELYAENTIASARSIDDLLAEYKVVREATELLFHHMSSAMALREGSGNCIRITPLALAFMVLGHGIHHYEVLEKRYFPLLS